MPHLLFAIGLMLAALVFALLEVQIEGSNGWASGLPAWRIDNRWTRSLLGNRAVTGYHVYFHLLLLTFAHLPWLLGLAPLAWRGEARILAFLVLFWILEDYLWFVVNPAYGARAFTKQRAWWHAANWWGFMPRDYWIFLPIGVGLYLWSWS